MEWVKALRLKPSLMAGILTFLGFKLNNDCTFTAVITSLFVVIGAVSTMVLNDYIDRDHDLKKGKSFAHFHSEAFKRLVIVLWTLTIFYSLGMWVFGPSYGIVSLILVLLGLNYSLTMRVFYLSTLAVALSTGIPVLYSYIANPINPNVLLFAFAVFLFVNGSEILQDIRDFDCDKGYKKTLPCTVGKKAASIIAAVFFAGFIAVAIAISEVAHLAWLPFVCVALLLFVQEDFKKAKRIMDFISIMFIAFLLVC